MPQDPRPSFHFRPPGHLLAAVLTLGTVGTAGAEGDFQVRLFSVQPPQGWLDSVSVSAHYRTPPGSGPSAVFDLGADRSVQTFGVQYSRPGHSVQLTARRSTDDLAGRSDTSLTGIYTYVPQVSAEGVALTYATALYTLSASQTPTFGYSSHTFGGGFGVRLSREVNASANLTATVVNLSLPTGPGSVAQDALIWSGNLSTSLTYGKDNTSAYLVPGVSIQNGSALFNVVAGGSTRLTPDLSATGNVFWSSGTVPNATAALTYQTGPWQFSGTAAAGTAVSFGVGTRVNLPENLSLGATAAYAFSSRTPSYAADVSKTLGGVLLAAGVTLSTPPELASTLTARASVSAQQKPWQGNLAVSYSRTGEQQSGNASGTLSYDAAPFGAQVALALNLAPTFGGPSMLTGRGDLTLNYAVTPDLDASASLRYERSVATDADAHLRYGLGLRYRIPDQEKR